MSEKLYTKLLVAKHNPQNGCYVTDDGVLTIIPKDLIPRKDYVNHFFVSINDMKTKSKYGWVKEVESFTLDKFLGNYPFGYVHKHSEVSHIETMLNSIRHLPEETPVVATYNMRGVLEKVMCLTVHKVFFYPSK